MEGDDRYHATANSQKVSTGRPNHLIPATLLSFLVPVNLDQFVSRNSILSHVVKRMPARPTETSFLSKTKPYDNIAAMEPNFLMRTTTINALTHYMVMAGVTMAAFSKAAQKKPPSLTMHACALGLMVLPQVWMHATDSQDTHNIDGDEQVAWTPWGPLKVKEWDEICRMWLHPFELRIQIADVIQEAFASFTERPASCCSPHCRCSTVEGFGVEYSAREALSVKKTDGSCQRSQSTDTMVET